MEVSIDIKKKIKIKAKSSVPQFMGDSKTTANCKAAFSRF